MKKMSKEISKMSKEMKKISKEVTKKDNPDKDFEHFQLSSNKNRNFFISYMLTIIFIFVVIVSTQDVDMLIEHLNIRLPITNTNIGLLEFYLIVPFLLICFYYMLLFNAVKHIEKIIKFCNTHENVHSHKLQPFLLDFAYFDNNHPVFREVVNFLYVWSTPVVLTLFLAKFSAYQNLYITAYHFVMVVLSIFIALYLFKDIVKCKEVCKKEQSDNNRKSNILIEVIVVAFIMVILFMLAYNYINYLIQNDIYVYIGLVILVIMIIAILIWEKSKIRIIPFYILMAIVYIVSLFYFVISIKVNSNISEANNIYKMICSSNENNGDHYEDLKCGILFPRIFINPHVDIVKKTEEAKRTKTVTLIKRSLKFSHMSGVILDNSDLQKADFSYANLEDANIKTANVRDAIFHKSNLQNANFICSDLEHASFKHSDMTKANFNGVKIYGDKFVGANLEGTQLFHVWIKDNNFSICKNKYNTAVHLNRGYLGIKDFKKTGCKTKVYTDGEDESILEDLKALGNDCKDIKK